METTSFLVHATKSNFMKNIMRHGLDRRGRSHVHIAEQWQDVNRRDGCDAAVYMSLYAVAKEHKIWRSANGTLMIKGPILPHLFLRAGCWKSGGWQWEMMDGKTTPFMVQSSYAEATIRVDLTTEANYRIKNWNATHQKPRNEVQVNADDNTMWIAERNSFNDQMKKFVGTQEGRWKDVSLEAPSAPKKPAYTKTNEGDTMSPEYMTETSEASEFGKKQRQMNVKAAKEEERQMRKEMDTNIPMNRKRTTWGAGVPGWPNAAPPMQTDQQADPELEPKYPREW
jgi:hypothetical protein